MTLALEIQIDIFKIDYSTDQSVKYQSVKYRTGYKMRNRSREVTKFGRRCYVIYIYALSKFQVVLISRNENGN